METIELKFLLKLLGCPNYRSSLSAGSFKDFKGKDKICRDLGDRGLVDFSREIASVKILPPGRALIKTDKEQLPLKPNELKVLEKIGTASGKIKSSEITAKSLKAAEREVILQSLSERGLIEAESKMKRERPEVWLTQQGEEYLRDEYSPIGSQRSLQSTKISLDLLNNYLRFLRKSQRLQPDGVLPPTPAPISKPTDEEILQIIRDLDQQLGTENYLPIFHLRQKLQPSLSREDLDQALYRLQRSDQIELSALVEAFRYSPEEVNAAIQQQAGSPLFFIQLTAE
ncbi:MAG TPA: hypothetical protein V6D30_07895 [Leptolyngbyaceae cyanobacterium]|jgi:hypothetical protein